MKLYDLYCKNILVFDLETIGLPKLDKGNYFDYKMNEMYDSSRIVSVGWILIEKYDNNSINYDLINEKIVKPDGFEISPRITLIHGISQKHAMDVGMTLDHIINNCGLGEDIIKADYLVAHNCLFDLNILLNEFYRMKFKLYEEKLKSMLDNNKYLCTLKYCRSNLKLKKNNLGSVFFNFYNEYPQIVHSAKADVETLLKIVVKLYEYEHKMKIKKSSDKLLSFIEKIENKIK